MIFPPEIEFVGCLLTAGEQRFTGFIRLIICGVVVAAAVSFLQ